MSGILELFGALPGQWEIFEQGAIWRFLLRGLWVTVQMSSTAILLSLLFGTVLALLRVSPLAISVPLPGRGRVRVRPLAWLAGSYIELIRALPSFLIIFYTFLVAPRVGLNLSPRWSGIVGLTIYTSAVMAEIVRAGIISINRGLIEAARSLGMTYVLTMRLVILPVALRRMTPSLVGQAITLNKDTSLTALITVPELTSRGRILFQSYFNPVEVLLVVAVMYFIVNYTLSLISRRLELVRR